MKDTTQQVSTGIDMKRQVNFAVNGCYEIGKRLSKMVAEISVIKYPGAILH